MTAKQQPTQNLKSILGAALLVTGIIVLFTHLDNLSAQFASLSALSPSSSLDLFPSLVMAATHSLPAVAFDRGSFFAMSLHILVSFWPLLLVFLGVLLLRNASSSRFATANAGEVAPGIGGRS